MSVSDEDIQASAKVSALRLRSSANDTAHYFRERTIIRLIGDLSDLSDISVGAAQGSTKAGRFVSLLTDSGHLDADLCVSPYEDGALVDVHVELADRVADRLADLPGVTSVDRSAGTRWRIFGELPDQSGADTPYDTIRFMDSRRRELGSRVFRDAAEPEGLDWRHARKWDGHALRLGLLPDHRSIIGKNVKPEEAGYHRLLKTEGASHTDELKRRVLPVRIDVYGKAIPPLAGRTLYAGETKIGDMLDHEGVCGVALISIDPWRKAVAEGARLTCEDLPALITWPTWLSSESEGRVGPAAQLI